MGVGGRGLRKQTRGGERGESLCVGGEAPDFFFLFRNPPSFVHFETKNWANPPPHSFILSPTVQRKGRKYERALLSPLSPRRALSHLLPPFRPEPNVCIKRQGTPNKSTRMVEEEGREKGGAPVSGNGRRRRGRKADEGGRAHE